MSIGQGGKIEMTITIAELIQLILLAILAISQVVFAILTIVDYYKFKNELEKINKGKLK